MTDDREYAALHRAVLAQPGDDLPRLVLCDWLEERAGEVPCDECVDGDVGCGVCEGAGFHYDPPYSLRRFKCPHCNDGMMAHKCMFCSGTGRVSNGYAERAEFIRTQIALHKMRGAFGCKCRPGHLDPDCNYLPLKYREKELFDRHKCRWFDERMAILWLDGEQEDAHHDATHAFVSRGFVGEVHCTLAAFMGGICEGCGGEGRVAGMMGEINCKVCSGTGRTPGIANRVQAEHPVTKWVISDCEPLPPNSVDRAFSWHRGSRAEPSDLPDALFYLIPEDQRTGNYSFHATREEAMEALAAAALLYAKSA